MVGPESEPLPIVIGVFITRSGLIMRHILTVALLSCSGVLGFAEWSFGQNTPAALKPAISSPTADGQQGATPAVQGQQPAAASLKNTKNPTGEVGEKDKALPTISFSIEIPAGIASVLEGLFKQKETVAVREGKVHPLKDVGQSGVNWVFPFKKARQQAEQDKRLLLIIPITGVKVTAKGDW